MGWQKTDKAFGYTAGYVCGRFTLRTAMNILLQEFHAELRDEVNLSPRYNVAPTQDVLVIIRGEAGARELTIMRWGLVPGWARGPKLPLLINARADTVAEKPAFRDAFKRRRGLMLADGFSGNSQQSSRSTFSDVIAARSLLQQSGNRLTSSAALARPHLSRRSRTRWSARYTIGCPRYLRRDDAPAWLDSTTEDAAELLPLLHPYDAADMESWPVSKFVSNARNEAPECVEPLAY
jgi:putative SOS response-associated peptidase YedK